MVRLATTLLMLFTAATVGGYGFYAAFLSDLPETSRLGSYRPPPESHVLAADGRELAEFAGVHQQFVPVRAVPRRVIQAFLAAEDKNFYSHSGIDPLSVVRAGLTNLVNLGSSRRPLGASTITQQVAKNMLLTSEQSLVRKVREAVLAVRIEQTLPKDRILELYLNEIYLGYRSRGVAAAAQAYFGKSLAGLTLAETAFLAALPKGPNNYDPDRHHDAAVARRNWVLGRMAADGDISAAEAAAAQAEPLVARHRSPPDEVSGAYYGPEVRRQLLRQFGEDRLLQGGLLVRTALDPRVQGAAERALRGGLITYDRRHGWRGPVTRLSRIDGWQARLAGVKRPPGGEAWQLAVVLGAQGGKSKPSDTPIGLADGRTGIIPFSDLKWARPALADAEVGPEPRQPSDVLHPGDVILVEATGGGGFALRQIPEVQGGLVAMEPATGRVLAMVGGFSPAISQFNRATQAMRQPGSAFKPFVYLTALENGFTPSSLVLDAPFDTFLGFGAGGWAPENYQHKYYGPTPLRVGLEKSRNLMTVRLAQTVGMNKVKATAERFGITDSLPPYLSMALGSGETTVLRLASAYAALVNGGRRVAPSLIDLVQDGNRVLYHRNTGACYGCVSDWQPPVSGGRIADPRTCYQIVNILTGVVQRGTAARLAGLGRPLGGKTGTTNDSNDAWFVGFTPTLVIGIYVGFDRPRTLGDRETGGSVAVPIFERLFTEALRNEPAVPFPVPPGLLLVRTNPETGAPAAPEDRGAILEAFLPGTEPGGNAAHPVLGGGYAPSGAAAIEAPDSDPTLVGTDSYAGNTALVLPAPEPEDDPTAGLY
ncbi:MAG: penicillin-binding protein 1A [Rhodospirillaceae bacterium]